MSTLSLLALLSWLLLVMVIDLRYRKIPNLLSLGGMASAGVVLLLTGNTVTREPALVALAGLVLALLLTVPGHLAGKLGAGDVKLLAAIGLLCGLQMMLQAWMLASIAVFAWFMLRSHQLMLLFAGFIDIQRGTVAYGAALAAALILILLYPDILGFGHWRINELFY